MKDKCEIVMSALLNGIPVYIKDSGYVCFNQVNSQFETACDQQGNFCQDFESAVESEYSVRTLGGAGNITLNRFYSLCSQIHDDQIARLSMSLALMRSKNKR